MRLLAAIILLLPSLAFAQAFPQLLTDATTIEASDVTSYTVNMPSGIADGDRLVCIGVADGGPAMNGWPGGWTVLEGRYPGTTGGLARTVVTYKDAGASEPSTITVTHGGGGQAAVFWCGRFNAGENDFATTPPEMEDDSPAASTSPNPPPYTPTYGSDLYGWIAAVGWNDGNTQETGCPPANYGDCEGTRTSNSTGTGIKIAYRQYEAATEDPGAFTLDNTEEYVTFTIAIPPAASSGALLLRRRKQ